MATNIVLWLPVFGALLGSGMGDGGGGLAARADGASPQALRAAYTAEIGVREATGNNDGPRVAEYLRYCGLDEGYEWCAAFVSWCHGRAGYAAPRNAWAAALFPESRTVWSGRNHWPAAAGVPVQGDVFGIYIAGKRRIAHCGFVDQWEKGWCLTVEGNVENGVVRKRRSVKTIRAVSRWREVGK